MKALAILALLPVAIGPLPQKEEVLVAPLCNGGTVEIPLGGKDEVPSRDCHQQACHAGNCRERLDRDQGRPRS